MSQLSHPHILVVEDDSTDVEVFNRFARRHGIDDKLHFVSDGEDALGYLNGLPAANGVAPALVLTDLNMPGMDGHDMIEEIRNTPAIEKTVILVVSTSDLDVDVNRAYQNGVAGYVVKDTSGDAINDVVLFARHYCSVIRVPTGP